MFNVGIVGYGFVGKAVEYGFRNAKTNIYLVDPLLNTTIDLMNIKMKPDIVFVAVPTPMNDDGSINSSIIERVMETLAQQETKPIVVIKSTITPAVIETLQRIYPRIVYNPEFLTERNANFDFINAEMLVLGGENKSDLEFVKYVYDNYSNCIDAPVYYTDLKGASMIKYTLNCFKATKVLFFNQLNTIFKKSGTSLEWNDFINIVKADKLIGDSHMSVPGPDGKYGYGGACFPKDTTALVKYARDLGAPFTTLEEVVKANQEIRSQYDDLDAREKEQNVSFKIL
jgi:UDPglucose 6-dehydrogenase